MAGPPFLGALDERERLDVEEELVRRTIGDLVRIGSDRRFAAGVIEFGDTLRRACCGKKRVWSGQWAVLRPTDQRFPTVAGEIEL